MNPDHKALLVVIAQKCVYCIGGQGGDLTDWTTQVAICDERACPLYPVRLRACQIDKLVVTDQGGAK